MKKMLAIFMIANIVGCASPRYVSPENGPTAKLNLPLRQSSYKLLGGVSTSGAAYAIAGEDDCGRFISLPQPKSPDSKTVEVIIPANKKIFVSGGYSFGNSSCGVTGSFVPEENISYSLAPQVSGKFCSIILFSTDEDGKAQSVKLERAYVDTWVGKTVCSKR
jgi:hypothetical protein